ncbi:hypothetical protein HQ585_06520 [candidate division KSB1 bacterium]|nr:hypothetical protein [candidate division KSB1 bacterium]
MSSLCNSAHRKLQSVLSAPLLLIFLFIYLFTLPSKTASQESQSSLKDYIQLTGQSNIYGELYSIKGTNPRRPPSTGRISFTPTLRLSKFFTVSAQLLLSTEGSSARQNINLMGLHPVWKWGKAHIGDYSDHFSKYTFNGVNVKGAEIDLFPDKFRFTVGGGQTRRAVEGILVSESFAQYMFTSRIGYGSKNGSFFDLIFLKAKDDAASLKKPQDWDYTYVIPDTLESELDTLWIEPPYNPLSVTPQENMVIGFNSKVQMFQNRLVLEMEGNGSAFTKDLNTSPVVMDSIDASGLVKSCFDEIYTPRAGSNFDFALNTHLGMNLQNLKLNLGFRHIGPGYVSLGIPSTVNDRQEWLFNTAFKLGIHRFRFGVNRLSDNLLDQKEQTNIRNQFQASVATIMKRWRSQVNIRWMIMNNNAPTDSLEWAFNNIVLSTHQALMFGPESMLRQIGLQYTYQTSNKELFEKSNQNHYHTINLTSNLRFVQKLTLNTSIGLSFRDSNTQGKYTTQVYSLRLIHLAFQNKLSNALFSSSSMVRDTHMLRAGITSSYRLTKVYQITFNLSYNNFRGTRNFREFRSTLMLSHHF